MTAIGVDLDTEILQGLDWEESVPCSYRDCDEEATHFLTCGACGISRETMCAEHTKETIRTKRIAPEARVIFDTTCLHEPELGNCPITPMN